MTNASIKTTFASVSVFAIAAVFSLGAFAIVAHADDDMGYYGASDNIGYYGGADSSDLGYYGGSDNGGYVGASSDDMGYYGASDNLGYFGGNSNDMGYFGASDNLGYFGASDNLGYFGGNSSDMGYFGASDNLGYMGASDNFGGANAGCDFDCGGSGFGEQGFGGGYGQQGGFGQQGFGGGQQSFGQQSQQRPFSVSAPGYSAPSMPQSRSGSSVSYSQPAPVIQPIMQYAQQQQQQQQIQRQQPASNFTSNTCTGNSCNTNVNNIDNSVNGSFNTSTVTPVSQVATAYRPIQYVFPQQQVQNLSCTITASPNYVQNGQAAYLSWTSYGASSAWLSDGIGSVSPNGSLAVRPSGSTSYTLTVTDWMGRTQVCNTFVTVNGVSVSLSQIPYTGFDFGPFGNAMYFASLLAFAVAGAYLVVYYMPGLKLGSVAFASLATAKVATRAPAPVAVSGDVAAPSLFAKKQVSESVLSPISAREFIPAREVSETTYSVGASKDSMSVQRSSGNDAPRIVITRS